MKLSRELFKLAKVTNDVETLFSFNPVKIFRRFIVRKSMFKVLLGFIRFF